MFLKRKQEWNFEKAAASLQAVSAPLPLNIQFFAVEPELYTFGLADITITKGDKTLSFDGKDFLQVDGGEISLVPQFREVRFKDFGDTVVQRRLSGWEGTVSFTAGQENKDLLELALAAVDEITDTATPGTVSGYTDAKMGAILEGYEVNVHPRGMVSREYDYTIYQMASTGGLTKPYNDEQTSFSITMNMMPRVGFDASKGSNFFYTGAQDPNAA